jgi:GT2 family glycosyltransferase
MKTRVDHRSPTARFSPRWVTELDVTAPLRELWAPERVDGYRYERARILLRAKDKPIGYLDVDLSDGHVSAQRLARALAEQTDRRLVAWGEDDPAATESSDPPFVSVIVASRDRGDSLRRTLASLAALDYPDFEVVVVDSGSRTDETALAVDEHRTSRLRLVRDPRGGLSRARNLGARRATGSVLAFTDDDVLVDPGWLRAVVRGFARAPAVDCVTGLVCSAELETAAQAFFDARVGWGEVRGPRLYDLGAYRCSDPRFPYFTGLLGTGANFALTRSAFDRVGPFDEALGAGSPSQAGEDLDYFLRILLSNGLIAYEPSALVWHVHRRDGRSVARQMYSYGSGLTAYICKHLLSAATRRDLVSHLVRGSSLFAATAQEAYDAVPATRATRASELCGLAAGPVAYLRSRRRQRREERTP